MNYDYAYQAAIWICNNSADLSLFLDQWQGRMTESELRLIYSCVNRQKDMIDVKRLKKYFTPRKA